MNKNSFIISFAFVCLFVMIMWFSSVRTVVENCIMFLNLGSLKLVLYRRAVWGEEACTGADLKGGWNWFSSVKRNWGSRNSRGAWHKETTVLLTSSLNSSPFRASSSPPADLPYSTDPWWSWPETRSVISWLSLLLSILWQGGQHVFAFMSQNPGQFFRRKAEFNWFSLAVVRAKDVCLVSPWLGWCDRSVVQHFSFRHRLSPIARIAMQSVCLHPFNWYDLCLSVKLRGRIIFLSEDGKIHCSKSLNVSELFPIFLKRK